MVLEAAIPQAARRLLRRKRAGRRSKRAKRSPKRSKAPGLKYNCAQREAPPIRPRPQIRMQTLAPEFHYAMTVTLAEIG